MTNHVLSGAIIGRLLKDRPVAAALVGVVSHLALDAVPHWNCGATETDRAAAFLRAAKRDGVLGLAVMAAAALAVERPARPATVAAMSGAVLLDLDKPSVYFFGVNPFPAPVQRIHERIQNESRHGLLNELCFGAAAALVDLCTIARQRGAPARQARP